MGQRLAGRSWVGRSLAGGSKAGQLSGSLLVLLLGLLGDRACRQVLSVFSTVAACWKLYIPLATES